MSYVDMVKQCIDDITKYWYECKDYAIMGALAIVAVKLLVTIVMEKCGSNRTEKTRSYYVSLFLKLFILFLDGLYVIYLVYVTLGMRYLGQRQEVNLLLFRVSDGEIRFVIENLLLFIPYGFLLPLTVKRWRKISRILLSAFVSSLVIEICQYFFKCGKTEIDDVILNVTGAFIGWGIYKIVYIPFKLHAKK